MFFYTAGILFYYGLIRLAALFHRKAKLWVKGRRDVFTTIETVMKEKIKPGDKVIWFHCASLGEFEQGRPVLEKLKQSNYRIVLTFFSPSGYEIRKEYEHADAVFYLPIDLPQNAARFLELVKPHSALFVKYEFWLNYLAELHRRQIPFYLVSGVFRPGQHFFKWYGRSFFRALGYFKRLFVQDENSLALLKKHGFTNAELAGDTRFDRVMEIARNRKEFPRVRDFCGKGKVIIGGSTWPKDEELLLQTFSELRARNAAIKLILVPHEVDEASMAATIGRVQQSGIPFALFSDGSTGVSDILIIDAIGMLSQIYQYAAVAYVGGGFDDGIHNILEVMAHGVPVAFGPNYHKFVEASEATEFQLGRPVHNQAELYAFCSELLNSAERKEKLISAINSYMRRKTGATEKVCKGFLT